MVHCLIEQRLGRSTHRSGESILAVGADSHHRIGECVARFPFSRHFVGFLRVRVKAVSRVSIQVTPSAEGFRLHPTNNTLQHGIVRQSVGLELPHRRVLVGRRQYGDIDRAPAEGRVCKPIRPSAGIIPCLTAYRLFQSYCLALCCEAKAHVAVVLPAESGKDGPIARFHPEVGISPVECTGIAVVTIDTHDIPAIGIILQGPWPAGSSHSERKQTGGHSQETTYRHNDRDKTYTNNDHPADFITQTQQIKRIRAE